MTRVTGVRFRGTGKIYYFAPGNYDLKLGDKVIVETARGKELGEIRMAPRDVEDEDVIQPLKEIIRVASDEDIEKADKNKEREKEAFKICKRKIHEHELEMKLVDAEYTFEGNKLLFYFTADGRVDFRDLVKDLASSFHTRIELRQIGVRDETRIMGGIGPCGRELCCKSWLTDFVPVSIKMAKEQSLSLNPTKISGVCGRLMCCLKNEQESYEYLNSMMPRNGDIVTTPDGEEGYVISTNVLRQQAKIVIEKNDEKEVREYSAEDLTFKSHRKKRTEGDDRGNKGQDKSSKGDKDRGGKRDDNRKDNSNRGGKRGNRQDFGDNQNQNKGDKSENNNRKDRQNRNEGGDQNRNRNNNRRPKRNNQGGEGERDNRPNRGNGKGKGGQQNPENQQGKQANGPEGGNRNRNRRRRKPSGQPQPNGGYTNQTRPNQGNKSGGNPQE